MTELRVPQQALGPIRRMGNGLPVCTNAMRHWWSDRDENLCSHCGLVKTSVEIDVLEARPGDLVHWNRSWWTIVEFFPGAGDQVRFISRHGHDLLTAFVTDCRGWRRG